MIPQGGLGREVMTGEQPNRTYRIDFETKRIVGMIDGLEAIKQAALKLLQTERYAHDIYSGSYGIEVADLLGEDPAFVKSELGRRLRAALLRDDRISDIKDIQITVSGDEALVKFTVMTHEGSFEMEKGMNRNV